jgi:hypothetical protein
MHNTTNANDEIHVERLPFQQIPDWVFESEISTTAIKLYLVLRKNGDNERGTSYWSRKKLGEQMRCTPGTIDRAKAELVAIGAICYINRKSDIGDWTSNLYHIHATPNQNCRYLHAKIEGGSLKNEGTGSPKNDAQTNNHIELRTNELTRTYGDDVINACNLLADLIEQNGSKRPDVTDNWLRDMERLHRIDGRSWEQITAAINWVQNDSFWRANVMSPSKLRAQYDQLRLKAQAQQKQSAVTKTINWLTNINWDEQKEIGK